MVNIHGGAEETISSTKTCNWNKKYNSSNEK